MIKCTFSLFNTLLLTSLLTGCGLTQSVTEGTKSVANAVFYKKVKTVFLEFRARAALNPDEDGMPLTTQVQIFTLKERQAFDKADYDTLINHADGALSHELLAKKIIHIQPQQTLSFTMPMDEQAQYVAIVAQYRMPDIYKDDWRLVLKRDDLDPDKARIIEAANNRLTLLAVKDK